MTLRVKKEKKTENAISKLVGKTPTKFKAKLVRGCFEIAFQIYSLPLQGSGHFSATVIPICPCVYAVSEGTTGEVDI
jgi:hypothetical protein